MDLASGETGLMDTDQEAIAIEREEKDFNCGSSPGDLGGI